MTVCENIKKWVEKIIPKDTAFEKNKLVYHTPERYLAEIMKLKLEENGIPVILINKRDSSYNNFGEIELYVHQDDVIRAKFLIDETYE